MSNTAPTAADTPAHGSVPLSYEQCLAQCLASLLRDLAVMAVALQCRACPEQQSVRRGRHASADSAYKPAQRVCRAAAAGPRLQHRQPAASAAPVQPCCKLPGPFRAGHAQSGSQLWAHGSCSAEHAPLPDAEHRAATADSKQAGSQHQQRRGSSFHKPADVHAWQVRLFGSRTNPVNKHMHLQKSHRRNLLPSLGFSIRQWCLLLRGVHAHSE